MSKVRKNEVKSAEGSVEKDSKVRKTKSKDKKKGNADRKNAKAAEKKRNDEKRRKAEEERSLAENYEQQVRKSKPDYIRLEELSKPGRWRMLNTWRDFHQVLSYDRMQNFRRKVKEDVYPMLNNPVNSYSPDISFSSYYQLDDNTNYSRPMSQQYNPPIDPSRQERINALAKPAKWRMFHTFREYNDMFDDKRVEKFKERLQEEFSMTPEETEVYFSKLRKNERKSCSKKIEGKIRNKERSLARQEAYNLIKRRLRKALKYARDHDPPVIVSPALRHISDKILDKLAEIQNVDTPDRESSNKKDSLLVYTADWAAKLISNIYYEMEVKMADDAERFHKEQCEKEAPGDRQKDIYKRWPVASNGKREKTEKDKKKKKKIKEERPKRKPKRAYEDVTRGEEESGMKEMYDKKRKFEEELEEEFEDVNEDGYAPMKKLRT